MRQDSKKLGRFLGKCTREIEIAKQNGQAIYSQIQKVASPEIILGLSYISAPGPRKRQNWWAIAGPAAMINSVTDQSVRP